MISKTCTNFLSSIEDDRLVVKLYKYRYFLTNNPEQAKHILNQMLELALSQKLIGDYEAINSIVGFQSQKVGKFKQYREQFVSITNKYRNQLQHAESISNYQQMAKLYLRLGDISRQSGYHLDAANYYNKLFRSQTQKVIIKREVYFEKWALQIYLCDNYSQLGMFLHLDIEDPKKVSCSLSIIKDLKLIDMKKAKLFQNLLSTNYTLDQIIRNQVISIKDLGFIYSLVGLAKKERLVLKKNIKWSSKLEVLYLKNQFKNLLKQMEDRYQKFGQFHPLISKIYNDLSQMIRFRVFETYLSAYADVSFEKILQACGFRQSEVKIIIKQNSTVPYLIDPITSSVIYYQKSVPLYDEAYKYYSIIKQKYNQQVKGLITQKKLEQQGSFRGFGGMMGMMGRRF